MKNEKEIEAFIKYLKRFYNSTPKQKTKLIKKIMKIDERFGNWLNSVRDFNYDMQLRLYEELRCSNW